MSDPLKTADLNSVERRFDPTAQPQSAVDDTFMARVRASEYLKDLTFQQQIDNKDRLVNLFSALRPDLKKEDVVSLLPNMFESMTGSKAVGNLNPLEAVAQSWDRFWKSTDIEQKFRDNIRQMAVSSGASQLLDLIAPGASGRALSENIQQASKSEDKKAGEAITLAQMEIGKTAIDHGGPWWLDAVDNTTQLAGSLAYIGRESAVGALIGGTPGAAMAGWNASSRLMSNSSFKTMVERGVDPEIADISANVIGWTSASVEAAGLGGIAHTFLAPLVKKAALSSIPAIARALTANAIKTASATGIGTAEEVIQEGIAIAGENLGYDAQNRRNLGGRYDQAMKAAQTAGEILRANIDQAIQDHNDNALVPMDNWPDIGKRIADTAVSSAMGMGILGSIGGVAGTVKDLATIKKWQKAGDVEKKIKDATAGITAALEIQKAPVQAPAEPIKTAVADTNGQAITVHLPVDQQLNAGKGDLESYVNGVRLRSDRAAAETDAQAMSRGPLEAQPLIDAVRAKYPAVMAEAVQAVIEKGKAADLSTLESALKEWNAQTMGQDYRQILDLAQSVHDSSTLEDRNAIIVRYGLQSALPSGGIIEAQIQADKVAHVDTENQIDKAFTDGAQAVEFDGDWYVRDPKLVIPTAKTESRVESAVKNPVGKVTFQANDNTLRALASDGREAGRVKIESTDHTVSIRDLMTTPEFRRQGVAKAIVDRIVEQHPGKVLDWGPVNTEEGKAFQESVRQQLPGWKRFGPRLKMAEASGNVMQAEYLRQKLDTIPSLDQVFDTPLDSDQLRKILSQGLTHDETDVVLTIAGKMADYTGRTLDDFLDQTLSDVRWVNGIRDSSGVLRSGANGAIRTIADSGNRIIELARGRADASTILHEMFHALRPMLMEEDAQKLLEWTGESEWNQKAEELAARGFEAFLSEGKTTGDSAVDRVLSKLAGWLRVIYGAILDNPAFVIDGKQVALGDNTREVFNKILTVNNTKAREQVMTAGGVPVSDLLQEDSLDTVRAQYQGTDQWMKAPNGKPTKLNERQWLQTRAPEFKAWFGNSKAVDDNGDPLVVYHGSPDARFMATDATFKSQKDRLGFGMATGVHWFTPDERTAKTYADDRRAFDYQNAEPAVITAFVKAENPMIIDGQGQEWRAAQRVGKTGDAITEAMNAGYDSLIIRNVKDSYQTGVVKGDKATDTFAVFSGGQIKSATSNSGAFDPQNPSILYQEDITKIQQTATENERMLADWEGRKDQILAKLSKGKTSDEKAALSRVVDHFIDQQRKSIEADRKNLEAYANLKGPTKDQARAQAIQEAIAAGKAVPDAWIEEYKSEPWAKAELDRRADLRDDLEHARAFDSLDIYLASILEERIMAQLGDPFDFSGTAGEWDAHEKAVTSETYLTPEEQNKLTQVYSIAKAKTPEQLDKEFADSLTPDKVKQILAGMNQGAYLADKALPRHVTAQVTKSAEGGTTNEAEIGRILTTMKNDPRTYRRIAQQGFADLQELEALALEESVARATQDADTPSPVVKPIEIPTDLTIDLVAQVRLGTMSRAYWQRLAIDAGKEAKAKDREIVDLEKKLEEVRNQRDTAKAKATAERRDLKDQAMQALDEAHDRSMANIETALKVARQELKEKYAAEKAAKAQADQMRKMGEYLASPVPKTIHVDEVRPIQDLQGLVDPHFRTQRKLKALADRAEWFTAHPEAKMGPKLKREVFAKSLNDWTFEELAQAVAERKALEDIGREKLRAKKQRIAEDQFDLRQKILQSIYSDTAILRSQMVAAGEAGDNSKAQKLAEKILETEIKRAQNTRNLNQERSKLFDKGGGGYWLTISNLADSLDGMADYKGANHDLLWSRANAAENALLAETDRRKVAMFQWIKDNKIELGKLGDSVTIPGVERAYTFDELMSVYIGAKNERKEAALRYGNKIDQAVFDFAKSATAVQWVRDLGDMILQEYDENKARLFNTIREYDNFDPTEEENYSPMSRAELNMESMDAQLQWEAGMAAAVRKASVEKGFTKERIDIPEDYQKPIKLGEFSLWLEQVQRQEQYIAMTPLIKDLNAVYQNDEVKNAVTQVHGKGAWTEVDKYVKSLSNKYHDKTFSPIDKWMSRLSGNAAIAYMAYNIATVLKQASSLPLFFVHTKPWLMAASLAKLANPWALLKYVDSKSLQMKTRVGYSELDDMKLFNKDPVSKVFHKIGGWGMKPMQVMDKLIAAAGWDASYETAKANGLDEVAAVEYADWMVGKTQQSTHAKDTAGVMRDNNSLIKALTLFAGPSVKTFNEIVYGTRANLKNKHYLKGLGTILGVGASAMLFYGIGKGGPPEDESELAKWILMGFTNQIPIAGPPITSVLQGYDSGSIIINQAIDSAMKTGQSLTDALNSEDGAKRDRSWPKAIRGGLDIVGLGWGAPITPVKRVWKAVETGNVWELGGWHKKGD